MTIGKKLITASLVGALATALLWAVWTPVYSDVGGIALPRGIVASPDDTVIPDARSWAADYGEIIAGELKERMDDKSDQGFVLLDVRSEAAYEQGHIPGAVNIPLSQLGYRLFALDRTRDIIVYCNLGVGSVVACQILANAGFKDVYNLRGGLSEWNYAIQTSDGSVQI
jgi:rhodanese-related sulfurtransferase